MKKSFKEFLTKPGYSEGPRSLICHNGIYYKLDRIFELSLDLPVTKMPLSNLQWLIDANTADPERLKNANINVPIIVTPQGGQYCIIDGYHRVVKALQAGEKFIQARIIFDDILAMSRQGSGPSVGFASNVDDQNPYMEAVEGIDLEDFADQLGLFEAVMFTFVFPLSLKKKWAKKRRDDNMRFKYAFYDGYGELAKGLRSENKKQFDDLTDQLDELCSDRRRESRYDIADNPEGKKLISQIKALLKK